MSNHRGRRPDGSSEIGSQENASGRVGGGPTTRNVQRRHSTPPEATATDNRPADPSASTLTMGDLAFASVFALHLDPVQRVADTMGEGGDADQIHALAAAGVAGATTELPFRDQIQRSFGPDHDLGRITAAIGGPAATATKAIGATAYATGDRVAFASAPDLHTAAHEAAHVVQQQAGVHLAGGVGRAGDPYETHADAVANRVVSGQSAADLLAHGPGGGGPAGAATVQRKGNGAADTDAEPTLAPLDLSGRPDDPLRRAWPMLMRAAARARTMELQLETTPQLPIALTSAFLNFLKEGTEAAQLLASIPETDPAAKAISRHEIHVQLTKLARSSFAVVRHLGYRKGGGAVGNALAELGVAAAPLGWTLPTSAEEATARAHADEPCESDVALGLNPRQTNPEQCYLATEGRLALRNYIEKEMRRVAKALSEVTTKHAKQLEAAIAADEKFAATVTEWLIEALITVATAGAGKGTGKAVAGAVSEIGAAAMTKMLREIATKIATNTLKTIVKKLVPVAHAGATDNAARVRTIGFAGAIDQAGAAQLDDLDERLMSLDDPTLGSLYAGLSALTEESIEQRVAPILLAFQEQIAPIGDTSTTPAGVLPPRLPKRVTKMAVRVVREGPAGEHGPSTFALVEYEEDSIPALRKTGRAIIGAAAEVPRQMRGSRIVDGPQRMIENAWIDDPAIEVRFIAWIASPEGADFKAVVADDAPSVPAWRVTGLPLFTPEGLPSR